MTVAKPLATVAKLQGRMTHFIKYQEERDEYFLKIQERIEKIQGFKIDLGDKND